MRYREFGRTGWKVSEIGFGAWQIGGQWGKVDDAASICTLLYAFDRGINSVDTAQLDGHGHSETVIGEALRQWRGGKVYVATKAQPTVWPNPDDPAPQLRGRFPEWHLRANVEASLRRLGVERLDLFQLHSWGPLGHRELDWLETLNDPRAEGKIDQIGVSLRDIHPEEGVIAARLGLVASEQVIFNLFEQPPPPRRAFPGGQSRRHRHHRPRAAGLRRACRHLGRRQLRPLRTRLATPPDVPRRSLCGNPAAGPGAEGRGRALVPVAGRGRHALCPGP